jgi:hypothetical protein
VPAPEAAGKRLGVLVILGPHVASFTGELLCHIISSEYTSYRTS